ncbi:hypothetical protein B4U80_13775 [Leptotrombidium deliense]|uniref:Uncharacterized protein n=1 Tax=Leptotrombidium deliense TaxID=299467 RepID=A0A443SFA1_9ACAR|nr:hypothetical protein B4U80_13775 [Leptotrombidium deliense]
MTFNTEIMKLLELLEIVIHPQHDPDLHVYDMALFRMNKPIDFDEYQQLRPMSNIDYWFTGFGANNNYFVDRNLQQNTKFYDGWTVIFMFPSRLRMFKSDPPPPMIEKLPYPYEIETEWHIVLV